ncbi:MAG: hypothetical protein GKR99_10330 [Rhodobacteraceae bacterium]|nr:hypothetical protein [Paracoccaceae bacterium]
MPRKSPKATVRQFLAHLGADLDRLRGFPALRRKFRTTSGYDLDLENPKTLSEKIQWRKLYDRNPLFPILMNKTGMAEWAGSLLPAADHRYLPKYLQVVDDADKLDFSALPADLALKCNHASGWNVILREGEAFDPDKVRRRLKGAPPAESLAGAGLRKRLRSPRIRLSRDFAACWCAGPAAEQRWLARR